ncbi:UbiA family prenyltransferase [Burkholderia vietnamiensis]|uniref:UbiA family prenyltransferase n=1 Tax=Burkholderia vietnamiensis TaxID=60552 RepID=UPI001B9B07C3|nr:UbiA family prenyltransferase [Burkholderia vietnamiensis]MBR7971794.1 UbiA family prenyltransferase [Burkholderia vietnamiensis]
MRETRKLPLVVDLDGTLITSDTLMESVIRAVKHRPANLLRLPFWLIGGRASFKSKVAGQVDFRAETLPYRQSLVEYLVREREAGRRIVLATAAHRSIAERVNAHLGLFDVVIATTGTTNLKSEAKLAGIRQRVGDDFVYAGDSKADVPIWTGAKGAILAGVAPGIAADVRGKIPIEREFSNERVGLSTWLKALRVHQWLKNLLLFVPILTAFAFFDAAKVATLVLAFLSMSLAASATYIGNDLWDLDNDRRHPRKRNRAFANGTLSITQGLRAAALLLVLAFVLAFAVSPGFTGMLALYLALTTAYSWRLKSVVLLDVIVLSLLYTHRIVAGAIAADIPVSRWLLAFSVFAFLSLALVKRCSELVVLRQTGRRASAGRDYRVDDLEVLWPFGIGASLAAVVVFGQFINAPETVARYTVPHLLWFVQIGLVYLFGKLWIATVRGVMHDDPVIHIVENRGCFGMLCIMVALVLAAHFLPVL